MSEEKMSHKQILEQNRQIILDHFTQNFDDWLDDDGMYGMFPIPWA